MYIKNFVISENKRYILKNQQATFHSTKHAFQAHAQTNQLFVSHGAKVVALDLHCQTIWFMLAAFAPVI